ncbi:ATP-grasp domain-containing protein [Methylosarcina fibrata]|uniref:ATP-grasp domain-containing protein n=1 Tax=Methylosarcina fibrata TaxID=105972 RepID=UPI00035C1AF6|nr:ATP-grasp domain-containing protein [Methylosarcina fibrata]
MKILVFEYITGGGFNRQELPASLAREGRWMLKALLDGLAAMKGLDVTVMLDRRLADSIPLHGFTPVVVDREDDCHDCFDRLIKRFDAVWPVAPEYGGVLSALCRSVERKEVTLLTSPSSAVSVAGDKLSTYRRLLEHRIATVPTRLLEERAFSFYQGENIVKPVDGIGCADSYVIIDKEDRESLSSKIQGKGRYIVQPHVAGDKTSLSCLFRNGEGWLLCANRQKFELIGQQYHLAEIAVNDGRDLTPFRPLVADVARAFPELWGYAGIDLIETPETVLVLEINPRLTTSFAGIGRALGINAASLVLRLLDGDPLIRPSRSESVSLILHRDTHEFV